MYEISLGENLNINLNGAWIASEGADAATTIQNLNKNSVLKAFLECLLNPIKLMIIKANRFNNFHGAEEQNNPLCQSPFQRTRYT